MMYISLFRGQRMTPDKAELNYLHKVKWLDLYGVDMHMVMVSIAVTIFALY